MKEKLRAIFGGTFDPIHHGHLRVALEASEQLDALIHMVPANVPPHRTQPIATPLQRLHMLRLAIQNTPQLIADERELRRNRPSYTVDTLSELRQELGAEIPLALIVGWDAFAGLSSWHRWHEMFSLAHLCVLTRPGVERELEAEVASELYSRKTDQVAKLKEMPSGRIFLMRVTALEISASQIRAIYRDGLAPNFLLPERVQKYIAEQKIYHMR